MSNPVMAEWHNDHPTVLSVAQHAVDQGELHSAQEVIDFFEKPWHYPELLLLWRESLEDNDFPWALSIDEEFRECPLCEIPVRHDRYALHWNTAHSLIMIPRESQLLASDGRVIYTPERHP
jgi:hypothetical protein